MAFHLFCNYLLDTEKEIQDIRILPSFWNSNKHIRILEIRKKISSEKSASLLCFLIRYRIKWTWLLFQLAFKCFGSVAFLSSCKSFKNLSLISKNVCRINLLLIFISKFTIHTILDILYILCENKTEKFFGVQVVMHFVLLSTLFYQDDWFPSVFPCLHSTKVVLKSHHTRWTTVKRIVRPCNLIVAWYEYLFSKFL